MSKVVLAFSGGEGVEKGSDAPPGVCDGAFVGFSERGLELGKDEEDQKTVWETVFPTQVDGVQVRAVGRQEQQVYVRISGKLPCGHPIVAAKVVSNDDVAGCQGRGEAPVHPGCKRIPVDRAVKTKGATMRSCRSPARKVSVQCPCGA